MRTLARAIIVFWLVAFWIFLNVVTYVVMDGSWWGPIGLHVMVLAIGSFVVAATYLEDVS